MMMPLLSYLQVRAASAVPLSIVVSPDVPNEVRARGGSGGVGLARACLSRIVCCVCSHACHNSAAPDSRGALPPLQIMSDGARLRQIILNGLTNSVKYASASATGIVVSVAITPAAAITPDTPGGGGAGSITFSVTDDGAGLPAGVTAEMLFQDFNAVSKAASNSRVQSTGLGLPICNRLGHCARARIPGVR